MIINSILMCCNVLIISHLSCQFSAAILLKKICKKKLRIDNRGNL